MTSGRERPSHLRPSSLLFAASSLVIAFLAVLFLVSSTSWINRPFPGFKVLDDLTVDAQLPAKWSGTQAGLSPMDRLVQVDGRTFRSASDFYRYVRGLPVGSPVRYEIERVSWSGQRQALVKTIRTASFGLDDWQHSIFGFWLSSVFFLLIGIVVSILKPGDRAANAHFAFCAAGALNFLNAFDSNTSFHLPWYMTNVIRACQALTGFTLVLLFPRRVAHAYFWPLVAALAIFSAGLCGFSLAHYAERDLIQWTHLGTAIYATLAGGTFILMPLWASLSPSSSPRERSQAQIILMGTALAIAPMLSLFIGPLLHYDGPLLNIGSVCGILLPLAIAYAIVRHQLFDIDLFLRPSLTYSLLSLFLVALYIAVLGLASLIGHKSVLVGNQTTITNFMATVIVALAFAPTRDVLKRWLDKHLFRTTYDPDAVRTAFTTMAQEASDRHRLLSGFLKVLEESLHPAFSAVYLGGPDALDEPTVVRGQPSDDALAPARRAARSLSVPLREKDTIVGRLVLGPKKSEASYSPEDRKLVNSLSEKLIVWLSLFERVDREQTQARQLEAMHEAKRLQDQFLNTVSHELRTPVAVILASMHVLEHSGQAAGIPILATYLDRIHRNAEQLSILLDDLLNAGQLQSGRFTLSLRPIDPQELVDGAVSDLQALATVKRKHLVVAPRAEGLQLMGDAQRLGQVLRNLLINAIKYTPEDSTIEVAVRADGPEVRFDVKDHGTGIAPADLPKLFERFSRLASASDSMEGGVGLGLYIVKAIVTAHGGDVGVESPRGEGATFWFKLPCLPARREQR